MAKDEQRQIELIATSSLKPYERNARTHSEAQVEKICRSITEFGFVNPVLIDDNGMIIAGHGRVMAAKKLGFKTVPCLRVKHLTKEQVRAYIIADNKLAEDAGWDMTLVMDELGELDAFNFDTSITGFDLNFGNGWFENHEKNNTSRQEGNEEYNEFLDKFEIAKTTDDCYTPQNIYDVIAEWVAKEYGINQSSFVRPFYPGGDYQKENYKGKIVVDNPPFSILSEIEEWYNEHGVKYFLFAPNVSNFPSKRKCTSICVGCGITYENGAQVLTSFVTNLENKYVARTAPDLFKLVDAVNKENTKGKEFPSYEYPPNVVTAAMLSYLSKYGQDFRIKNEDASEKIGALDEQKKVDKSIFGGGYLISEKAAAEKAAAEKAAAEKAAAIIWKLSDRELEIIKGLGGKNGE